MYWTPNAQLVSKASVAGYFLVAVLLFTGAVLLLEGCKEHAGEVTAKDTTSTTTTSTITTTIARTTTTAIANGSSLSNVSAELSNASDVFVIPQSNPARVVANTSFIRHGRAKAFSEEEHSIGGTLLKYWLPILAVSLICLCGLLLLCLCCCRHRKSQAPRRDGAQKESDEATQMLHGSGSSRFESYPEDSRNPYECEFTRVAIESMIPEAEYIDEDEPDVS